MMAYCMRCKKKTEMKNPKIKKNKRGIKMAQGVCSVCGTKTSLILGK